jgi:hypothetical protein
MLKLSRWLVSSLGFGFGLVNVVLGLLHIDHFDNPALVVATAVAYLLILVACMVLGSGLNLPFWMAITAIMFVAALPPIVEFHHNNPLVGDYDSWYVTAIAVLLSTVALRGHILLAALGAIVLFFEVLYFGGPEFLPISGITGAVLLIVSCIAISLGLQRAAKEIERYQNQTLEEEQQRAKQSAANQTHREKLSMLIQEATPALELIASGKKLTKQQRAEIVELDAQLRDELSGGELVTARIRQATAIARESGAEVEVVDEGGAKRISTSELAELLDIAASAIESASDGERVRLTAPKSSSHVLRLTISRPGVVTPSLDLKLGEGLI